MNSIKHDIFKAIFEGKWLSIEYRNINDEITRYWIGIKNLDPKTKRLEADGLHLGYLTVTDLQVYIDRIISSELVEGTYQPINEALVNDIKENPHKYAELFQKTVNLQILNYLLDCSKMDTVPCQSEYSLIERFDSEKLTKEGYSLDGRQYGQLVSGLQRRVQSKYELQRKIRQLALNVLSVHMKEGLYVLAYRRMDLDVKGRVLRPAEDITVCTEFTVDGSRQSIRRFLDGEDALLLEDFEKNAEQIKDCIAASGGHISSVDDLPYIFCIERQPVIDLTDEYKAISRMHDHDRLTVPLKAFFGELTAPPRRLKDYPPALINNKVNLDQLLAIHNAMKNPVTYIQGPPGTGKTATIVNIIVTAFFNDRTVLFSSYNNHPIDGVFASLRKIKYKDKRIPFPILRLGRDDKVAEAAAYIKKLYEEVKDVPVSEAALDRKKISKAQESRALTELLKKHEEIIYLHDKSDAIKSMLDLNTNLTFQADLRAGQLDRVQRRLEQVGEVTDEQALKLLSNDTDAFMEYLYFTSARYIRRLNEPKYEELWEILDIPEEEARIQTLNRYLRDEENLKKLMRVFPVIATTCISAHKLGSPKPCFDMTVIDEASQCNTAMSLVPIIRSENLTLVGDPQQLNPVVVLDPKVNDSLKKKYGVSNEYDYRENSIYKTFLACDAVSYEILLHNHYRCARKIIDFNNKKYYNGKLDIKTKEEKDRPLIFAEVPDNRTAYKNTAPREAEAIVNYIRHNRNKNIGIITPFTNQKECIEAALQSAGIGNVSCGTVHAFQGEEKDEILFSLALTDKTGPGTYQWLKNNKELITVATSRAKDRLIVLSSSAELERLHKEGEADDIYELVRYVKSNGVSQVTPKEVTSRALGIKPYSTETEAAFLTTLNHALDNILYTNNKCSVEREVAISQVFRTNEPPVGLFYTGRFDFVIYETDFTGQKLPMLAIELDGKEHFDDDIVAARDAQKDKICKAHGFRLIRVQNSYARRYSYIKEILISYFEKAKGFR